MTIYNLTKEVNFENEPKKVVKEVIFDSEKNRVEFTFTDDSKCAIDGDLKIFVYFDENDLTEIYLDEPITE